MYRCSASPRLLGRSPPSGRLQRAVRVVGAEEVGVADEEALFVVVGIDEPAGDAVGAVADDFAGLGFEDIHAVHFYAQLAVLLGDQLDVRLAEDDEEVALAGVLESRPCVGRRSCGPSARGCGPVC